MILNPFTANIVYVRHRDSCRLCGYRTCTLFHTMFCIDAAQHHYKSHISPAYTIGKLRYCRNCWRYLFLLGYLMETNQDVSAGDRFFVFHFSFWPFQIHHFMSYEVIITGTITNTFCNITNETKK